MKLYIRSSHHSDISTMVSLSGQLMRKPNPNFGDMPGEEGDKAQEKWFKELLEDENHVMFTAENNT